jgi:preprotein translocase subunit YajC
VITSFEYADVLLAAAGPGANQTGQRVQTIGTFAIMGFALYFVLLRPQQKKAKEQAKMLSAMKSGDKITTGSGMVGIVVSVKDKDGIVTIRSGDSNLEILKSSIVEVKQGESGQS